MEKKVAVIVAEGFEEGETITIVDIFRRANIICHMIGFKDEVVGGHNIGVKVDKLFNDDIYTYDMIVLPGGYGGVENMLNNEALINVLKDFSLNNKWIGALCVAPAVLGKAGVLENKNYTAYLGYDKKINQGNYLKEVVVIDDKLITSIGPVSVYDFTYKLVEVLGGNSQEIKERMLYNNAFRGN